MRSPDQPHGSLVVAELLFGHSQKMQGIKMIGVLFQNLPISLLCFRHETALMTIQRVRQRAGNIVAPLGSGR